MLLVMNAHYGIGMVANIPKENERQVFIMKQKKRGRTLTVCLALCFTLLCGGTLVSHAVTPVCGGDHDWGRVRKVGRERVSDWETYRVADVYFKKADFRDAYLFRCECGAEKVVLLGDKYKVQVWID